MECTIVLSRESADEFDRSDRYAAAATPPRAAGRQVSAIEESKLG